MKLFPKLALMVAALVLVTVGALAVSFYWAEQRAIRSELNLEEQAILENLVHIAQESILSNDDLLLVKYAGWLRTWNPGLVSASVVGIHGDIRAHSEPRRIGQKMEAGPPGLDAILLSEPVYVGRQCAGTASVAFSRRFTDRILAKRLERLKARIEITGGFCGALGLAVSFFFAMTWARPLHHLSDATRRIASGDWSPSLSGADHRRDELGTLARSLQEMAGRLQELDQMKEDFVSAVTHELRSPLGAIESYLRLMREEPVSALPVEWPLYLERLDINTQRLTRFVNDLLDIAALDRGKIQIQRRPLALLPLLRDVLQFFDARMRELRLEGVVMETNLPSVQADEDKIRQVIVNFVSNAIKFTPAGGRIVLSAAAEPEGVVTVRVQDTGLGISEADQKKLFSKFEQVQTARGRTKGPKGTGLGLAVSRALVELHGGRVGIESAPGQGSTFYFTLPITPTHTLPPRGGGEGGGQGASNECTGALC